MKRIICLLAALCLALTVAGCSASKSQLDRMDVEENPATSYSESYDTAVADDYAMDEATVLPEAAADVQPSTGGGDMGEAGEMVKQISADDSRKIVITMDLTLQTMEFDKSIDDIESVMNEYDGYMEDSYVQGSGIDDDYYQRSANYTLRIPEADLEDFLSTVEEQFHVVSRRRSATDISDNYYDTEARLKSLRIQEERLLEMLETAGELEYLIQVQTALADVQYQIDSTTSALQRMQKQVSMSTVYIYLQEVTKYESTPEAPVTFTQRISYALGDSWDSFLEACQNFVIGLLMALPYLIIVAILLTVVIVISRRNRKRRKNQPPPAPDNNGMPAKVYQMPENNTDGPEDPDRKA